MQFADAFNPGGGLLHDAVSHQEHGVVARRVGAGKDDFVAFIDTGQTLAVRAHGDGDRGRGFAQRLQGDLFDLKDTGVGRLWRAQREVHRCGLGTDRDVGNIDAAQGADEFDDKAVITIATDLDVARTNAVKIFQGSFQGLNQRSVGHALGQGDRGRVRRIANTGSTVQGECAHQIQRHVQLELGVDLDALGLLGRQRDALVDVDQQVLYLDGEAFDANHRRTGGCGLQTGVAACGVFGIINKRQTKVDLAQAQTHRVAGQQAACVVIAAVDAGKGVELVAADGDEFGVFKHAAV